MHIRLSAAIGTPVVDADGAEHYGELQGILIHPDTGKVEGFFVGSGGFFARRHEFLASEDIQRWGMRIMVRSADVLSPVEDRIRLRMLLEEKRFVLSQPIITDTGRMLGVCKDVQFDTEFFMVDTLIPKVLWRWGEPIALSQILEVRKDAIVVRDPSAPAPEKQEPAKAPLLSVPEAA